MTRHGKPEQVPDAAAIARWFGATGITDADAARATEAVRRMLAAEALAHVFDPHASMSRTTKSNSSARTARCCASTG